MSGLRLTEETQPEKNFNAIDKLREIINSHEGDAKDADAILKLDPIDENGPDLTPEEIEQGVKELTAKYDAAKEQYDKIKSEFDARPLTVMGGSGDDELYRPVEAPPHLLGKENADPFGNLKIDNRVIGMLVDAGITDEATLRQEVAAGRDLTEIKGIGKVTQQEILDALVETDG